MKTGVHLAATVAATSERHEATRRQHAQKLDVVYVVNHLGVGGSEQKTLRIINGLRSRGVEAGVISLNGPHDSLHLLQPDVTHVCLQRAGRYSLESVHALHRYLQMHAPRCAIGVNLYPLLYVVPAARLCGRGRPRTVAMINTSQPNESLTRVRRTLYGSLLATVDYTVHGCETVRAQWHPPGSVPWKRSGVIYNGVDTQAMSPEGIPLSRDACRAVLGLRPEAFVFGSVGRLAPEKNQRTLVDTLARLRSAGVPAHLLLVGDGPLKRSLLDQVHSMTLAEYVTFTGNLQDVRSALKAMDVFVLPSTRIETFSNAALEAMAMTLPVILSDVGGAAEMVRPGLDGYIVPVSGLATEIPRLLQELHEDPAKRRRIGATARSRVTQNFSLDMMVDQHLALIP